MNTSESEPKNQTIISQSPLFNAAWYLRNNPDVLAANIMPAIHYLRHGAGEGRATHPFFDTEYYLSRYSDVKSASKNPLIHFFEFGWKEGRIPSVYFEKLIIPSPRDQELLKTFEASAQEFAQFLDNRRNITFLMKVGLSSIFDGHDTELLKVAAKNSLCVPVTRERFPWMVQPDAVAVRTLISRLYLSTGSGIEIGALHNPLPVVPGLAIKYVDRQTNEDLRKHYPELNDLPLVPVDIVSNGEVLDTIPDASQDFVIGNHFLEHCQSPLFTLQNFLRVLKPGGVAYIALPDKRVTFDKDRQITPLEHILKDYREGPAWSRETHFHDWAKLVEPHFGRKYEGEALTRRTHELMEQDYSIHYHTWVPETFHQMLTHCKEALNFPLNIEFFMSCPEEMIVVLRKI